MLIIENFCREIPSESATIDDVHGFYHDSIKHLFGVDVKNTVSRSPTRNHKILLSALQKSSESANKDIQYYFDIRFKEELGGVSPQYEILDALGLPKAQPICIRGMGNLSLDEGLSIAAALLQCNETALFSVSRLCSAEWQNAEDEFAIAFTVTSDGKPDKNVMIRREQ